MSRKHSIFISICILITCHVLMAYTKGSNCGLMYNGIYAFKLDNERSAVIRFYEDGTVLASSSVNDYLDVFSWFHKDNKDMVLKGKYKVKKCSIKFTVSGATGEQTYEGEIQGGNINFVLSAKESKAKAKRTYAYFDLGKK